MAWFRNKRTGVTVSADTMPAWGGEWTPLSTPARKLPVDQSKRADPIDSTHSAPSRSASRAVWAEYAESQGVDTAGLKRAEIVAKLEA